MDPKSLGPTIFLLATLVLLVPTVHGCVNFYMAQGQTNWVPQATWLDAKLWDGGDGSFTEVCTMSSDSPYNFNCNAGYSAVYNNDDANTVTYTTPGGSWTFATDYDECGGYNGEPYCSTWKACRYNCAQGDSDCFVYNCGLDYQGCKPGYSS